MGILKAVRELVFPDSIYCIGCGAIIDSSRPYSLCDSCLETFHFAAGKVCRICGRVLADDYIFDICNDCMQNEREYDGGYSCLMYGLYERELVRAFKYGGRSYYARHLGRMMADRLSEDIAGDGVTFDVIVPVPLYREKLRARGYNQAELLARELSRNTGIPVLDALLRVRPTKPMSRLSKDERLNNLEGAFELKAEFLPGGAEENRLSGSFVLLVDDVFTTGTTAEACTGVLKKGGAASVTFYALCSGKNPPPPKDE